MESDMIEYQRGNNAMSDYEKKIKLNDVESFLRRETSQYLSHILTNYGDVQCIEKLKHAAYFATDRSTETFTKEKSSEIKQWVYSNCSESAIKLFKLYSKEGKILTRKKNEINNRINKKIRNLKKRKTDMALILKRVNYALDYHSNFKDSSENKIEELKVYNEFYVLGLGTLLSLGLLDGYNGTHNGHITDEDIDELLNLAVTYYEFNDIIANWIFGDSSVARKFWRQVVIKEKQGVITDRIVSFEEYYDLNNIKNRIANENNSNCPDYLKIYKDSLREKVKEFFYTTTFTEDYNGISLDEWMKVYVFFIKLASSMKDVFYLERKQLIVMLMNYGFSSDTAEKIISSFSDKEKYDLFTNFLIEHDGRYIVIPSIIKITEPLKSMMNLFSKKPEFGIAKKGLSFEDYIMDVLQTQRSRLKIIHTLKENSHELDILMHLDDTLFIIECKTQFQHESIRGYYRNLTELDYYLRKFKRNADYFTQDPHGKTLLINKMRTIDPSFDLNSVKIVKVFVSNITYPFTTRGDVFILDATKVYDYFKGRQPIIYHVSETKKQLTIIGNMPPILFSQTISDESFMTFLVNSRNYIIRHASAITEFRAKDFEKYGIVATRYIFDKEKYKKLVEDYIESHST